MKVVSTKLVGRLWPNGEFGIGRVKETKENWFLTEVGVEPEPEIFPHGEPSIVETIDAVELRDTSGMDLINVSNSHSRKKDRGALGLTRYGARVIRNCSMMIGRDAPYDTVTFGTLTVPELSATGWVKLQEEWPEIVRVYFQWLSRKLKSWKLPGEIVYVVEMQPRREAETGIEWPHIHFICQGRHSEQNWVISPKEFGDKWRDIIAAKVPGSRRRFGKSHWNIKKVFKDPGPYLSKYLSKGTKASGQRDPSSRGYFKVASWWGVYGGIRRRLKSEMLILNTDECLGLIDACLDPSQQGQVEWIKDVNITVGSDQVVIWLGAVGKIGPYLHRSVYEDHELARALAGFQVRKPLKPGEG